MKILAAILVLAATGAAPTAAAPQKNYFTFKTPNGQIQCGIFIAGRYSESIVRCDIRSGLKPAVKRPKGCQFDYGSTLELRASGRAFPGCVSDAIGRTTRVVGYGQTYRKGPFTCTSQRSGLTCRNAAKHGFFLSRKSWRRV